MARRGKGEGSLYQDKTGSWIYQYKEDGKRKTKRFQRKADAKVFIAAQVPMVDAPACMVLPPVQPQLEGQTGGVTVGGWLRSWLEAYARPTIRLSTYASYEQYIRGHIVPQLGDRPLATLRPIDLQNFFNERGSGGNRREENKGLSPKTLLNMRNMLHSAFEQAVREGLLSRNIVEGVRLPKLPRQEMRVLDRQEQERLIMAVRLMPEPAAFGVIFDMFTGLRLGELCALRWTDVDLARKTIHIRATRNRLPNFNDSIAAATSVVTRSDPKSEDSRRTVPLLDGLYQDFVQYRLIQKAIVKQYPGYDPEGYVFCQENGKPYEPRTYMDLFKRCVRQAGIKDANFHSLRHTFATRALEEGMDMVALAKLMGHSDPSVTLKKYGHALPEHQRVSVEKLGGLYTGGGPRPADQGEAMVMDM